ncbi:MAG: rSAM/selenodomain-associated transferase 1 [Oleispira sp.]|jgi:rSAM/selenodomain-associated transferase 1
MESKPKPFKHNAFNANRVEWIVLTKAPIPGLVKTRLIPALGKQGACDIYLQLLARLEGTLKKLVGKTHCQVALWVAGDASHHAFKTWSDLATFYPQPEHGDLGVRMAMAVNSALARGCQPILIGVDVPDLDEAYLLNCLEVFAVHDVVISPAEDGGYGLLGMKQFYAELFVNKAWGTNTVFSETKSGLLKLNIHTAYLTKVWDVDELADVERFFASLRKVI